MAHVLDVLTQSRVRGIVSRIRTQGGVMARRFGFNIGGGNIEQVSGRNYTYDIYDNVRKVARGRMPGAPANAIAKNPVGNNRVTLGRVAEKVPLEYETLMNIRTIGENAGVADKRGVRYVEQQSKTLRQRHDNFREFVAGSLFRGGVYYFQISGESLIPLYGDADGTAPDATNFGVDLKIPAANKLIGSSFAAGMQMGTGADTITATWATVSNDIPTMIMNVNKGFQLGVGAPLAEITVDSTTWLAVLQNTYIRNLAGQNNAPFASYEVTQDKTEDGTPTGLRKAVIAALPGIVWHIYDGYIQVGPSDTDTLVIPDGYALFNIDLGMGNDGMSDWFKGIEGSEMVKDNVMAPAVEQYGFYPWIKEMDDPARFELHGLQNFGVELNTPKGFAIARVR